MTDKHDTVSAEVFDPVSFAERWYQEHPRALHRYIEELKKMQKEPRSLKNMSGVHAEREASLHAVAVNLYRAHPDAQREVISEWEKFRDALGVSPRAWAIKSFNETLAILSGDGEKSDGSSASRGRSAIT